MPSDLTGTPTSLGIGTYNTSIDAPSGLGFNEAMAQIDALLAARTKNITINATPPASPADGDIWILPNVDGKGTRWQFQYNAASASSFKWEFIGGAPLAYNNSSPYTNSIAATFQIPGTFATTLTRAGDYIARFTAQASNVTGGVAEIAIVSSLNGATNGMQSDFSNVANGAIVTLGNMTYWNGVAAGWVADVAYYASSIAGSKVSFTNRTFSVLPVRVS